MFKKIFPLFLRKERAVGNSGKSLWRNATKVVLIVSLFLALSGSVMTVQEKKAEAFCVTIPCWGCNFVDCIIVAIVVEIVQEIFSYIILENLEDHVNSEQNWILNDFFEDFWVKALAEMTEFLSAFGLWQVHVFGTFLDAKIQLETQRLFYQLHAEAHKDYHPSEDYCWFGTNARSMAATERRGQVNAVLLSERALGRQLGNRGSPSVGSPDLDKKARWAQFIRTYCDPKDNAWMSAGTGLDMACDHDGDGPSTVTGAVNRSRVNRDINFTRLIEEPRTLNIDLTATGVAPVPTDEEDVFALSSNLYGHETLGASVTREMLQRTEAQKLYLALRSVAAKRSVAHNSFAAIVALKSQGTNGTVGAATTPNVGMFMAAALRDLMPTGTPDADIIAIMGENPSYYAQLEFLAKKIYENPRFFANLYDKPANVARKSVAMKAIELMLDRAIFESELRQEMVLSVLLSSKLRPDFRKTNTKLGQENPDK